MLARIINILFPTHIDAGSKDSLPRKNRIMDRSDRYEIFQKEAREEFVKLSKKGLSIPVFTL